MKSSYPLSIPQDLKGMLRLWHKANTAYHTDGTSSLTDAEFDHITTRIKELDPANKVLREIGAPVSDREKVKLPNRMPSLDKVKAGTDDIARWRTKHNITNVVVSDKLDGISLQIHFVNGMMAESYTRGDGEYGKSATLHVKRTGHIPKQISLDQRITDPIIRAEAVLPYKVFKKKYGHKYKNPRNFVAGMFNRKTITENLEDILRDVHVICYEIMNESMDKHDQLEWLKENGFEVPDYIHHELLPPTDRWCSEWLKGRKTGCDYEIDGLVIEADLASQRAVLDIEDGNPASAVAYKAEAESVEANVVHVHWSVSHHGYLKPRIEITPVELSGVTVTYATAFNAGFVRDNNLGPGAKVRITRSGEVIPHILEVTKPGAISGLPDTGWHWNETKVDAVLDERNTNLDFKKRQLLHMLNALGVEGVQKGMVEKLYSAGFTTLKKLLDADLWQLLQVDGVQEKTAQKLHDQLQQATTDVALPTLMYASNRFGRNFGVTKFRGIYKALGDRILTDHASDLGREVTGLSGFSAEAGRQFAEGLVEFRRWLESQPDITVAAYQGTTQVSTAFRNQSIVFTGFRSDEITQFIESQGGTVTSGVSKKTTKVIVKDNNSNSGKYKKARDLGIPCTTLNQFKDDYMSGGGALTGLQP